MTQRFLPGIGRAGYSEYEEEVARSLIAGGHHDEVRFMHELKVELDAALVVPDGWTPTVAAQEALL